MADHNPENGGGAPVNNVFNNYAPLVDPVRREALDQAVRHAGFSALGANDVVDTAETFFAFLSKDTSSDD